MKSANSSPTVSDVREAHARIRGLVRETPVLDFDGISMKCENFQFAGAFKSRGACNAVFSLEPDEAEAGVVTHSSGNHAAALARAAKLREIPATVVMPRNSAPNKIANTRSFGAEIVFCDPDAPSRQAAADRILEERGGTFIHPYDDARIIAGQGTAALEWTNQVDARPDAVVVPVGGGGLLSGTLLVLKSLWPDTEVIAAEPEWADDAFRSLKSGVIEMPVRYDSVADGLRTPLGDLTFPIIRDTVDDILLVSETSIRRATRRFLEEYRIVVEPSGAVPLAALLEHRERFEGKRIGLLISGGNLEIPSGGPWRNGEQEQD